MAEKTQSRRFVLFGFSVSMLLLLGIYLLNVFNVREFGSEAIVLLFAVAVIALLVTDSLMKTYKMLNPLYFLVPGIVVLTVCYIYGFRNIAIAFALMLAMPGIVATARWLIIGKEALKKEIESI